MGPEILVQIRMNREIFGTGPEFVEIRMGGKAVDPVNRIAKRECRFAMMNGGHTRRTVDRHQAAGIVDERRQVRIVHIDEALTKPRFLA